MAGCGGGEREAVQPTWASRALLCQGRVSSSPAAEPQAHQGAAAVCLSLGRHAGADWPPGDLQVPMGPTGPQEALQCSLRYSQGDPGGWGRGQGLAGSDAGGRHLGRPAGRAGSAVTDVQLGCNQAGEGLGLGGFQDFCFICRKGNESRTGLSRFLDLVVGFAHRGSW